MTPGSSRQRVAVGLALLFALAATGCLQVDRHLILHADGSGRLVVRYGIPESLLADVGATAGRVDAAALGSSVRFSQDGWPPVTEESLRKSFQTYARPGLQLEEARIATSNGVRWVHLEVSFRDLKELFATEYFADASLTLTRTPAGDFVLRQAPPLHRTLGGDLRGARSEIEKATASAWQDFRADFQATVPGDIRSTTAAVRDGRTARWRYDARQDPGSLARARQDPLVVEFSGSGLPQLAPTDVASETPARGAARGGT